MNSGICRNCNSEVSHNYCAQCGHPLQLKRIDSHYIIHEIEHVLHFERGILYTIRELITNPGRNLRNYLLENRSRLVKPVIFIVITSLVYSICSHLFHFEDAYLSYRDEHQSATHAIFKWVQGHYGYANILMGVFIALWTKLFFKKYSYNLFEILIVLCFVMGMAMLIFSVFGTIGGITHLPLMPVAGMAGIVYITWAIGQFYDKGRAGSYLKAFFAYILGTLSFSLTAVAIGILTDIILKQK